MLLHELGMLKKTCDIYSVLWEIASKVTVSVPSLSIKCTCYAIEPFYTLTCNNQYIQASMEALLRTSIETLL